MLGFSLVLKSPPISRVLLEDVEDDDPLYSPHTKSGFGERFLKEEEDLILRAKENNYTFLMSACGCICVHSALTSL